MACAARLLNCVPPALEPVVFGLQAMREKASDIKAAQLKIFVRRGGPSWQAGLALMRKLGEDTGIPIEVYGPTDSMTGICKKAMDFIQSTGPQIAAH